MITIFFFICSTIRVPGIRKQCNTMQEWRYNWKNFYFVNLSIIVTALCSIKALLILVSWLHFIIKCVKRHHVFITKNNLSKEKSNLSLNLEMGKSRLWVLIMHLLWTKCGPKPRPIISTGVQLALATSKPMMIAIKRITVEPRLSGLVGTTRNSPDNRGSGWPKIWILMKGKIEQNWLN